MEHIYSFYLSNDWVKQFEAHAAVMNTVKHDMTPHMKDFEPDSVLRAAMTFFGWRVPPIAAENFTDNRDPDETKYDIEPERQLDARNPAAVIVSDFRCGTQGSKDRFDLLRELEQTITQLREHLRGINDPTVITPTVTHALSYLTALKEFVSTEDAGPPDTIPLGLSQGTLSKLSTVDWFGVSEKAAKLVSNIRTIMDAIRMIF